MGLNLSAFSSILKTFYRSPVVEQLNNASVFLNKIEQSEEEFSGGSYYMPLHTARNAGIGTRADGGTLPTAGNQGHSSASLGASYCYGVINITGPTIKASRNNRGAFLKAVDTEMKGMVKDLRQSESRKIFRNGDGELTACGTTSAATTVVCTSTKYLTIGQVVDIIDQSGGVAITDGTAQPVLTIPSATSFTIADAVTTTSDEIVVPTESYNQDAYGLESIVATGNPPNQSNYGGIDRTAAAGAFWQCATPVDYGAALTLDFMQQGLDVIDIESGMNPGLIVTSHALKRAYAALLQANKRYPAGGEITLDGGYKALEFSGVPLVADKDLETDSSGTANNRLYFLDLDTFRIIHMGDWDWMQEDGAVLSRVANKDAYEAVMFKYQQLACEQPNANTYLYT